MIANYKTITTRQSNRPTIKPKKETNEEREKRFIEEAAKMREKVLTTRDIKPKPKEEIDPKKIKNTKSLDMSKALKPGWGRKGK